MKEFYADKRIMVTGAAGTIGKEIVKQLLAFDICEVRALDNNETELFFLMEQYRDESRVIPYLGDLRDQNKITKVCKGVDIIIHAAALKHVIISEYNPFDVVQTNIIGVENVIRAANENKVSHVLFTSSDKAVNPTNVMGTSKLMGERLITAANALKNSSTTIFSSTRFGNVIGSRGSVVPIFYKQIAAGGPVTITDENMTRFVMTIEEAARLVLQSVLIARGGEVFITKMPVMRIVDLAQAMIEILAPRHGNTPENIKMKKIGSKPGEKLYEELMSDEEVHRSLELKDMFVVKPAFRSIYGEVTYEYENAVSKEVERSYVSTSEPAMNVEEIKDYLLELKVLDELN